MHVQSTQESIAVNAWPGTVSSQRALDEKVPTEGTRGSDVQPVTATAVDTGTTTAATAPLLDARVPPATTERANDDDAAVRSIATRVEGDVLWLQAQWEGVKRAWHSDKMPSCVMVGCVWAIALAFFVAWMASSGPAKVHVAHGDAWRPSQCRGDVEDNACFVSLALADSSACGDTVDVAGTGTVFCIRSTEGSNKDPIVIYAVTNTTAFGQATARKETHPACPGRVLERTRMEHVLVTTALCRAHLLHGWKAYCMQALLDRVAGDTCL